MSDFAKDANVPTNDCISRQAAIEAAKDELDNGTYFDIPSKIESLPSAQPEPKWIPCSERLPEDGETVIVSRDNDIIAIATFEVGEVNNGWWMDNWYTEDNVKAWMPLPEPYREEGENR